MEEALRANNLPCETIKRKLIPDLGEDYRWIGPVGDEIAIATRPARTSDHQVVMGSIGLLGTAARALRLKMATGAQGIVQLGMAFGINPEKQKPGDVLVSTSIVPYDNRDIKPVAGNSKEYYTDYTNVRRENARLALIDMFRREWRRKAHKFNISFGAILSGAARIHSHAFRDELVRELSNENDEIIGGEMEGVGLLAASTTVDDPIWCVVKGISDFADENRDRVIKDNRPVACRNAAEFVISALLNNKNEVTLQTVFFK